jgi:hypothetical protein
MRPIRAIWVAFADRFQTVRYEQLSGEYLLVWYRALRLIESGTNDAVIGETNTGIL